MQFIMKSLWWKCQWELIETVAEGDYSVRVYNIYRDTNKNWLHRYKKILVNRWHSVYNQNSKLLTKK